MTDIREIAKTIDLNGGNLYLVGGAVGLQFMNCPVSKIKLIGNNNFTGMQGIGGIVGTGFDLISDCSATADITVMGDDGACAGIIAGGTTMSSIKNCEVVGGSITAEGNATWGFGALCGAPWGAAEITDCKVSGTVIRQVEQIFADFILLTKYFPEKKRRGDYGY